MTDCIRLTKPHVFKRYSKEYFLLLKKNLWIQEYRTQSYFWQEECTNLWLPDLDYLWKLTELHTDNAVNLKKIKNTYIASSGPSQKIGSCPEEAMLKLFIFLEHPAI